MRHKGYETRTLIGLTGPVTIRRARYASSRVKGAIYPLDTLLSLPDGDVTPSLARRALHLTTQMSLAPAQEELRVQHDVRLTDSTLDALVQQAGGVAEADRQQIIARLSALPPGIAREAQLAMEEAGPPPEVLYVSTDGVMYPTRYREKCPDHKDQNRIVYQEMKAACVFWQDRDESWHKRVLGGRDDPQQFGLSVWARAMRCGMAQAGAVVFISDGGAWCDTVAETYFPEAVRILDFYHLSEYVWNAAHGLYANAADATAWAKNCLHILKESSGHCLLKHLERSRAARVGAASARTDVSAGTNASAERSAAGPAVLGPLDTLMNYLRPRLHMTDYSDYRAKGYVIGSGMMESTCKHLVGNRLKGSGRQWHESGAINMTALNALRINREWDRFWTTKPLKRAG